MSRLRATGLILTLTLCAASSGCGEKSHAAAHGGANASTVPEPAPPTPDTTPIEALRTPAGLVLKLDQPTPVPSTTPAPTP